jgi:hypothetical protein
MGIDSIICYIYLIVKIFKANINFYYIKNTKTKFFESKLFAYIYK